jgi:hypothetical protein
MQLQLNQIEEILRVKRSPIADLLQPGISRDYIKNLLDNLELRFPEAVYNLFAWHNGTKIADNQILDDLRLIPHCVFYSIEMNLDTYNHFAIQSGLWEHHYFPLLNSGGGDVYLINCDPNLSDYGSVSLYSPAMLIVEPEIRFSSVEKMVDAILALYQNGGYEFVIGEGLMVDRKLQRETIRSLDPEVDYWKQ